MGWSKNGTPDTLVSSGDQLDINDLTKLEFNEYMIHALATGGAINIKMRHGSTSVDSGTNYTHRFSINGAADGTVTSNNEVNTDQAAGSVIASGESGFFHTCIYNLATEEKLAILEAIGSEASGAGAAPSRSEFVYKWVDTTNQFDIIESNNGDVGSYDTSSNMSALGFSSTNNYIVQDGLVFEETDTNKHYQYSSTTDSWTQLDSTV